MFDAAPAMRFAYAMAKCRLCKRPPVEDSMFCAQHRTQAESFFRAFRRPGEAEAPSHHTEAEASAGGSATQTAPAIAAPPAAPAVKLTALRQHVDAAIARLIARVQGAPDSYRHRWPLISLYYLDDQLTGRPYFSTVPGSFRAAVNAGPPDWTPKDVAIAMADGSLIYAEVERQLAALDEGLRSGKAFTLDVHFAYYADVIAINAQLRDRSEQNVATFLRQASGWSLVPLTDVRARLRHERWAAAA